MSEEPAEKITPPGGFDFMIKNFRAGKGSDHFRDAAIEALDTAEFAVRWLVDHGIAVEPGPLATLTDLILQRADRILAEQRRESAPR